MSNDSWIDNEEIKKLPNGVAISWGFIKQSKRGPKGELSIDKIVEAAVQIADQDGLGAVSMNRVAASLGFTPMSLYRYITSKDDLLVLMQEAICKLDIPPLDDSIGWREEMRQYVQTCIYIFNKHPWFGDIPVSGIPLTPNNLVFVDWGLRTMRHFPLSDYEKMSFILLLSSYARSVGIISADFTKAIQSGVNPETINGSYYTGALKQLVTKERYPYLAPLVESGAYTEDQEQESDTINDFDFGLERILDGIEHYLNHGQSK
ncbi:TetR/AcrR family transcriptional regulator [Paenibacillus sp. N1-5-1-14]|uniref:TetR/AcrR family transcriptional regulator n=1 Tax=Paenibacillus radicibacter TaxID=2972488 RepID=UPI0021595C71|nr:TetR/AcrR family transcriptional regulator [Paenibacillus radicibacter]MCR8643760.1 TetR/AcrR family transcriptional regulator [Paenibacillus radicibacter]